MPADTSRLMLEKLCKWRSVLAGWHLGTKMMDGPGVQAMRDLRELTMLLRVEMNAMTAVLIAKGVFTADELRAAIGNEAAVTDTDMERRFPGIRTSMHGVTFYDMDLASATMKRLGFPE